MIVSKTQNISEIEALLKELCSHIYPNQNKTSKVNSSYFEAGYFIKNETQVLAAFVLYNNPELIYENEQAHCFGNFEALDHPKAVQQLISFVFDDIQALEKTYLIGPMNGSTWDQYRFNIGENSKPFLSEFTHPSYYNNLFKDSDFQTIASYQSKVDYEIPTNQEHVLKLKTKFLEMGVILRSLDLQNYDLELKKLHPFVTKAFQSNFLYTPISWEDFHQKYSEVKALIQNEYVLLAEFENEIIGFIFAFPNLLNPTEKQLVIKTIARSEDKKWQGLGHVIGNEVIHKAKENGFQAMIHAFMYDEGTSQGISNNYLGKAYKAYELLARKIK